MSKPNPREVRQVFGDKSERIAFGRMIFDAYCQGDDDREALTPEEAQDLADSGLTLHEWLHPDAAARREKEREG